MYNQHIPAAPLSTVIKAATLLTCVILAVIIAMGIFTGPRGVWIWPLSMVGMPVAILLLAPLFMVRGYVLESDRLRIQRLGWSSSIDLRQVRDFYRDPEAMKGAWRLCGNGGFFCFSGYFRSKKLGNFRPFVTNPGHAVVILTAEKTWVVSPRDPESLVTLLAERFGSPVRPGETPVQTPSM